MKLHDLIQQSYQNFLEQSQNARVVLLHPRSRYRSVLVAKLINAPGVESLLLCAWPR